MFSSNEKKIRKLCVDVIGLDESILAVALCSYEGKIWGTEIRKEKPPWKGRLLGATELSQLTELLGPRVSVVLGVADQSATVFGALDGVIAIYANYNVLVRQVPRAELNVALMLEKSCNLEMLLQKLGVILKLASD